MKNSIPRIIALERAFAMLDTVIADRGISSVSALARDAGMPVSTAHRQVATLVDAGYLRACGRGRHVAGPRLLALLAAVDELDLLVRVAAPTLEALGRKIGAIVQLGTLDNDMITYRLKAGQGATELFTRVGGQLEAYCSGIGKVLLANLPAADRQAYLASAPFVALTPRTITAPDALAETLDRVRIQDFATDLGEVADGLACLAVPVRRPDGTVVAGISASTMVNPEQPAVELSWLPLLHAAAQEIASYALS
jgi:IclR family transcriptional regulator, acetate operon repressor